MTTDLSGVISIFFILFCRVGACIMTMPGFGSERIPMRVRLYIAIGLTAALVSPMWNALDQSLTRASIPALGAIVVSETLVGVTIGLSVRLFFLALESMATIASTSIGLGNILGAPIHEGEPLPALASFVVLSATTMIFVLDQHWELLRGLGQSYEVFPVSAALDSEAMLRDLAKSLDRSFVAMFRICSPFLLFGLATNVAFGFLNRLIPQVPIYFVSAPILIFVGVYWMYLMSSDVFSSISADFALWLRN
jgi:flagellar biosynthetic protein FliR